MAQDGEMGILGQMEQNAVPDPYPPPPNVKVAKGFLGEAREGEEGVKVTDGLYDELLILINLFFNVSAWL